MLCVSRWQRRDVWPEPGWAVAQYRWPPPARTCLTSSESHWPARAAATALFAGKKSGADRAATAQETHRLGAERDNYRQHGVVRHNVVEESRAGLGLAQLRLNKLQTCLRDFHAFIGMMQIILAAIDQFIWLDHDEVPARHQRAVALASFGDDATAIGQTHEYAMPLEIFLLGIVEV